MVNWEESKRERLEVNGQTIGEKIYSKPQKGKKMEVLILCVKLATILGVGFSIYQFFHVNSSKKVTRKTRKLDKVVNSWCLATWAC